MQLIDSQEQFDKIIEIFADETVLFIDTEFHRRDTYYAKLCLIQVSTLREQYVIDTLSGIDISSFAKILSNRKIVKVIHSADQDILIFYHMFGILPKNIFDTQIAASVCGLGKAASYQKLCMQLLDIEIDKSMQRSNWQQRPLSQKSIEYAVADVMYLIPLYEKLRGVLRNRNLWQMYKQQIAKAISVDAVEFSPYKILARLKTNEINNKQKNSLIELITFREDCARKLDIPRNFFLTDKDLIKLSSKLPITSSELNCVDLNRKYLYKYNFNEKLLSLCAGLREM